MKTRTLVLLATLMLGLSSFQFSFGQNLEHKFDAVLNSFFSPYAVGGVALVAQRGDILYQKAFGKADLQLDVNMEVDHRFGIASCTKPFTASAIIKLSEEGKLSLQDDIRKYIPDFKKGGPAIRIEHLLSHTSGVINYTGYQNEFKKIKTEKYTDDQMIEILSNRALDFEPGTKYAYSNSGYFLLGYIIEKVSGKTYGQYLRECFFDPLGMEDSGIINDRRLTKNRVSGYQVEGERFVNRRTQDKQPLADGGIITTVKDLHIWYDALINGKVISLASFEKAIQPFKFKNGKFNEVGHGWFVGNLLGSKLINHDGRILGYTSSFVFLPEEKIFAVVFSNCSWEQYGKGFSSIPHRLAAITLGKELQSTEVFSMEELAEYQAVYEAESGDRKRIRIRGNKLFLQLEDRRMREMIHSKDDQFVVPATNETITFKRSARGNITTVTASQGSTQTFKKTELAVRRISLANKIYEATLETDFAAGEKVYLSKQKNGNYYFEHEEMYRAALALIQSQKEAEARLLIKFTEEKFPAVGKSLALFALLKILDNDFQGGNKFLERHKASEDYFVSEDELNAVGYNAPWSGNG